MTKKERHSELINRVKASERAKRVHKAQWFLNTLFFKGYQWQQYNEQLGMFQDVGPRQQWKIRLVDNFIKPIVLTMAAKLTQNRPIWVVLPATMDSDDINKARVSQRVLDYTWEECELQPKLYDAVLQAVLTGQGFWALYWDRDKNPVEVEDIETREMKTEMSGFPAVDVVSPFDIGLDPMADTVENCEWGYRIRLASTAWVKKALGKKVEGSESRDWDPDLDPRQTRSAILNDADYEDVYKGKYVPLYEFYDIVAKKLYWFTQDDLIKTDDWIWPVPFVEFPFIRNVGDLNDGVLTTGGVWGDTVVSDLVPLQMELNKTESQIIEIKNLTAFPRLLTPRSAQVQDRDITDMPGSRVPWSGNGQEPKQLQIGHLQSYVYQLPDRIIQRMFDISGVHEISQGASPGSIQSGRGLAILAEMDATKFGPCARNISRAIRQAAIRILKLWKAYSKYPQTLRVVGESNMLELHDFDASTIESFDVIIQEGSTMGTSKSLRTDQVLQMFQLGIEPDRRKVKKMLEFGDIEQVAGDFNQDRLLQRREIQEMRDGEGDVTIQEWDDDYTHLDEIESFLKSTQFPKEPQKVQAALVKHWQAHNQIVQAEMQAQMQAANQRGVAAAGAPKSESTSTTFNTGLDQGAEANPVGRADQLM